MGGGRLRLANAITASRVIAAIFLVGLFPIDGIIANVLLVSLTLWIFASDVADGIVARAYGSVTPGVAGTIFDLATDNFVIITAAACFLWYGILPAWLAFPIIWVRCLMTLVRMLTLAQREPFAAPRRSTKVKGVVYGLALIFLVALYLLRPTIGEDIHGALSLIIVVCVAASTAHATVDFFWVNRSTLLSLFAPPQNLLAVGRVRADSGAKP